MNDFVEERERERSRERVSRFHFLFAALLLFDLMGNKAGIGFLLYISNKTNIE